MLKSWSEMKSIPVKNLIPFEWEFIKAQKNEDLVFFGKDVIRSMIVYWRKESNWMVPRIKKLDSMLSFIQGNIIELAQKYENPCLENVGLSMNSIREIVPLDPESIMREEGTTTFNVCGWCNFAKNLPLYAGGVKVESICNFESVVGITKTYRRFDAP
jgi:hypothetical protein